MRTLTPRAAMIFGVAFVLFAVMGPFFPAGWEWSRVPVATSS